MLVVAGISLICFSTSEINARSSISLSGTIIQSKDNHIDSSNYNRYITQYVVKTDDNKILNYTAENNDHSLKRSLPVGTRIEKVQGHLEYRINGTVIDDFPVNFYLLTQRIGIILVVGYLLGLGIIILVSRRNNLNK